MVTIVLADDHAIVRQGLRALLESNPLFEVVGEGGDGREAMELVKRHRPALLIADLMMPGSHGLQLARNVTRLGSPRIRKGGKTKTRVIILSMYRDEAYVREAFRNGASAYIAKESSGTELFQAIKETLAGHRYLSPVISDASEAAPSRGGAVPVAHAIDSVDRFATLTAREQLALRLVVEGASAREIAVRMRVGIRAVEAQRLSLMRKLQLKTKAALVRYAIQRGVALTPARRRRADAIDARALAS